MKKIIGILTAFAMTLCTLSCVLLPAAIADDSEGTSSVNELIPGNINDVEFDAFSVKLEGDSIKFFPNKFEYSQYGGYNETVFFMDIATNDKVSINNLCFTPKSNGKYIVVIGESFSDYYNTFVSLVFYYVVPIICHDNIVDIDTDNIYALCDGESYSYIVKTTDKLYKGSSGTYPINIVLPEDKPVYSFKKFDKMYFFEEDKLIYLMLSCFFEDHFYYGFNLILLSKDSQSDFYADYNTERIIKLDGDLRQYFGSFKAAFQKDLSVAGIDSINGMKPASKYFSMYPDYIRNSTVLLKDSSGITKYHIDLVKAPPAYDYSIFAPETFTSIKIPEKDINLDGAVNLKDVAVLRRYIAGGWGIELNKVQKELADINADNSIDLKDVVLLRRYIAGGWD